MSAPDVLLYPDPRLRQRAADVETFDDALAADVARLVDGLKRIPARGLAGPHLGIMRRIVAIDLGDGPRTYVNPVVTFASAETETAEEGSVSMPGISAPVERAARVTVSYVTPTGDAAQEEASGFRAACLLHEIDQLDGIFWIERLSRLRRDRILTRYAKLRGRPDPGPSLPRLTKTGGPAPTPGRGILEAP